jgi:hypothetical protein
MDEPDFTDPELLGNVRISHLPWEEGPTSSRGDVPTEADLHQYMWRPGPALAACHTRVSDIMGGRDRPP